MRNVGSLSLPLIAVICHNGAARHASKHLYDELLRAEDLFL